MNYIYKKIKSPVGILELIATDAGLAAVLWENEKPNRVKIKGNVEDENHPILVEAEAQLKEYFQGKRKNFSVPLAMQGTEFQKQVWQALLKIPFGQTKSYGELAEEIKNPKACRAVGAANGKNPISIIVPCHRVKGASGGLTGFAGGLEVKAQLLDLESKAL